VSYVWPKPGGTEPVEKVGYVTKVGDQVCGVRIKPIFFALFTLSL
jgi:hypothetical protein